MVRETTQCLIIFQRKLSIFVYINYTIFYKGLTFSLYLLILDFEFIMNLKDFTINFVEMLYKYLIKFQLLKENIQNLNLSFKDKFLF